MKKSGVWLTVNRRCNFRCKWCYADGTGFDPKLNLTKELAMEEIDMADDLGIKTLLFIGGEPTLWKPLIECNAYAQDKGMKTTVVTNGFMFSNDRFWEEFKERPCDSIALSVKAGSQDELIQTAGVKNWDMTKKAHERVFEFYPDTIAGLVYNMFYVDTFVDVIKYIIDRGGKRVGVDFCGTTFANGKPSSEFMVKPDDIVKNIMRDYTEIEKLPVDVSFMMPLPLCAWPDDFIKKLIGTGKVTTVCHVMKRNGLIFDVNGNILMCNGLFDYPIGVYGKDYHNSKSLKNLLNSKETTTHYNGVCAYPHENCMECDWYDQCGGGCPLRWAVYNPQKHTKPKKGALLCNS